MAALSCHQPVEERFQGTQSAEYIIGNKLNGARDWLPFIMFIITFIVYYLTWCQLLTIYFNLLQQWQRFLHYLLTTFQALSIRLVANTASFKISDGELGIVMSHFQFGLNLLSAVNATQPEMVKAIVVVGSTNAETTPELC